MIRNPENCRCSVCFESIMIRHLTTVWFISPRQFAVKLEQGEICSNQSGPCVTRPSIMLSACSLSVQYIFYFKK